MGVKLGHQKIYLICATIILAVNFASAAALASYTAIVGKGLSAHGSVLFFHQEDLGTNALQHVRVVPRQSHDLSEEPTVELYWIEIAQVETTYGYVGVFTYDEDAIPGGLSAGMNEHGVTIAMNVGYPKEAPPEYATGLLWSDFMKVVLERAKTAREGIEILGWLTEQYHLTDDPGQMYGVADPNEGWIFESTPTRWVAKRVPDDGYAVRANAYGIGSDYDLASDDLIDFAVESGWYDPGSGEPFAFADVYTSEARSNLAYNYLREERSEAFLNKAAASGGISVEEVMRLMRDHYEGTFLYHDPPDESPHRNIELPRTVASIVAALRSDLPPAIGGVAWISLSPPATTPYLPFYARIDRVAPSLGVGRADDGLDDFDPGSAWWSFNVIRRQTQQNWRQYHPIVQGFWGAFEEKTLLESKRVERRALAAWQAGDHSAVRDILVSFSEDSTLEAQREAHQLRRWLVDLGAAVPVE